MMQLFEKGGPVMWPLLVLSILVVAVTLERLAFLFRASRKRKSADIRKIIELSENDEIETAIRLGSLSEDPVANVLSEGLRRAETCYEEAISCAAEAELDEFERGLPMLDTAVTLAPLMGLLGTVTGMIRAFGLLGASELDAPVAITGGIAEALIATAFGLTVAIVSLLPLNILSTRKERLSREIEDSATRLQIVLKSRFGKQKQVRVA